MTNTLITRSADSPTTTNRLRVALPPLGCEAALSETEAAVLDSLSRFAAEVMRPLGITLDRMTPEEVIAPQSPLWDFYGRFAALGFGPDALEGMSPIETARLKHMIYETLGWGDAGLAISLGAGSMANIIANHVGSDILRTIAPSDKLGCWAMTEPDHGSDIVDFNTQALHPGADHGRYNCIADIRGHEIVISGQKSAWVSNGSIAQICLLYCAATRDGVPAGKAAFILPMDAPGVTRGKPLDKLGQRSLNQGELFFDEVRLPIDHMAVPPESYVEGAYAALAEGNALMGAIFTGVARAAYEHAFAYAHQRRQGGVPLVHHQNVRYRLFHMFRRVEASRALSRRVLEFNESAPLAAFQGSIAAKITATQTAFEVASDALQMLGGNGLTKEYPVEKLLRDARASMIEDGCNEVLAIKGGSYLVDPDLLGRLA